MKKDWEILRQWAWRISQLSIVLAIASGLAYWNFAAISVIRHKISSGEIIADVMGTGTLEARVKSTISPKIAGRIHEILVDQGSNVTSGQPLFTLDDAELKQQVEIAQATTAMWQASLARLQADLDQAKAVLDSAQKEFKRIQQLLRSNSISEDESEKSTERLHIAEAGLARANAALLEGQRQITTSDKTLAFNEARLADTRRSVDGVNAMTVPLAIETRNLNKVYSSGRTEVVALREATLQIPKGQVVALLGPSGSGKSTLLTIIGLVIPPTSGQVFINGELIVDGSHAKTNLRNYRRQNVGFVFQKANLIPFLSAIENVQIAMELNHTSSFKARRRAAELLDEFGVLERSYDKPSRLSGGEQLRVAIARALANNPAVILADEPTAALDSHRAKQVMELFAKIAHEQNAGVIVVTHDHRYLEVFDAILEIEDGVLRQRVAVGM